MKHAILFPKEKSLFEANNDTRPVKRTLKVIRVHMETKKILKTLGEEICHTSHNLPKKITGVAIDSRQVKKGGIFIAIRGSNASGEEFIHKAEEKGAALMLLPEDSKKRPNTPYIKVKDTRYAAGIIASLFFGQPSERVPVIAVTGTNGKTTVTYLLESILKEMGIIPGIIGTVSYRMGEDEEQAPLTTPDPVTLQGTMAKMVARGAGAIIMEASSHALDQRRLTGTKIKYAVFTNMTRDHLDYHKTMDNYFMAKQRLFLELNPKFSIFNIDDPYGHILYLRAKGTKVSYALEHHATITPKEIILDSNGIEMVLDLGGKAISITSPLMGRFNAYNILAAVSAALSLGASLQAIQRGVYRLKSVPGRMEKVSCDSSNVTAFVDYAHTPDAVRRVLMEVRRLGYKRIITVIGCGGDRDKGKRPLMGYLASRLSHLTVLTSDNPRNEDPLAIIGDMIDGIKDPDMAIQFPRLRRLPVNPVEIIADREKAIRWAVKQARPGDAILVLGKGHEQHQLIKGKKRPFDDRFVLMDALKRAKQC